MTRVLVARLDNDGDVLLTGPAVRAVAAGGSHVTYLCSPRTRPAAELLPGVDDIVEFDAPWITAPPPPVDADRITALIEQLTRSQLDQAIVMTSFHQSPLPLALLLRLAGASTIAAISPDYPGSLLDVRHLVPAGMHEVERNLSLVATLGHALPGDDDGRLRVQLRPAGARPAGRYVVVHPGASVPARGIPPALAADVVAALAAAGNRVVVTGSAEERIGAARAGVVDLSGATDLAGLASVIAGAQAIVVGNTGPAHLAAAVGTPVVCIYAPTVPAAQWRPWRVPHVLLGDQGIACAGCRARVCPYGAQPCVAQIDATDVVRAVESLREARRAA